VSPVVTTVLTPFQLDALCLGGFVAVYVRQPGGEAAARRAFRRMAFVAGAVLVLQFGLHRFTDFGLEVPALDSPRAVPCPVRPPLLLEALFAPASSLLARFFRSRPMTALGKYSYGLYVYHHFLSYYFNEHHTDLVLAAAVGSHALAVALLALGGMAVSMAVAWLSYELFEKHPPPLEGFWPSSSGAAPESRADRHARVPALGDPAVVEESR